MSDVQRSKGVSRRSVAKGMAWSVPAVAVATAAPAFAASGGGPNGQFNDACKQPGASCKKDFGFVKGYTFTVTINNPTSKPLYIYPTLNGTVDPYFNVTSSVPFSYASARLYTGGAIGTPLPPALSIPAGGFATIIINAGTNSNSANTDAAGTLVMAWGHTSTPGADPDHPYVPAPSDTNKTGPFGAGWFVIPFSFASTPPCGTDCAPGGDATPTGP